MSANKLKLIELIETLNEEQIIYVLNLIKKLFGI